MSRHDLTSARGVAHRVLLRIEGTQAFADVLLDRLLGDSGLGDADRRLATQLTLGTLAWQGNLDAHLAPLMTRPMEALDPPVRMALRLGAYQLLHLERVPPWAAIDESVTLAGHRGARALVNAVLRRLTATPSALPQAGDPVERLAAQWSHPTWLVRRWQRDLPSIDLAALLAANNERAPVALRPNRRRLSAAGLARALAADGITTTPGRWCPEALVVERGTQRVRTHPLHALGAFTVQSEASQLVATLVAPASGDYLVDLCAAPGGKTGALAERIGVRGLVVAIDRHRRGVSAVHAQATRLGPLPVRVVAADGCAPPLRRRPHAVLVDAPCSGLGTLRRHPEIRWRRTDEDPARLARLQLALLRAAATLVRPGGVIVYAVCTLTHDETWGVVESLRREVDGIALDPADTVLPPQARGVVEAGAIRTLPSTHGLDGFFAVRLRTPW